MAKLINKILSALNNDNVLDSTIENISICKENLVKNLSNSVFDSKSKKSLLNCYNTLADSERDQVANRTGRERGRKYPYCSCADLLYDRLPDYKKNSR